ncbi:MAG: TlpA family protein disulfide reductase [Bacteroidetes bacterium]|nr:MAG: TlpA family protein disulfide reductase [Bacteroidota bacterium]
MKLHKLLLGIFLAAAMWTGCSNSEGIDYQSLTLTDLQGKPVSFEEFEGKRILLNFWATWCGPCLKEMPDLEKARQELEDEGYVFLLVSDEETDRIRSYAERKPQYHFRFLKMEESIKSIGIFSIPQTYIIDSNGKVVHAITGATHWASEETLNLLRAVP